MRLIYVREDLLEEMSDEKLKSFDMLKIIKILIK